MSNWTHVAAIIRIDSLRVEPLAPDYWEKIIGRECLWDSPDEVWHDARENPNRYLPMGSEGSLRMVVWEDPDQSHLAAYTVSIFGDLRDHDDTEGVIEWFREVCECLPSSPRNAVIEVQNEWSGTRTWSWCAYDEERGIEQTELLDLMYEETENTDDK